LKKKGKENLGKNIFLAIFVFQQAQPKII